MENGITPNGGTPPEKPKPGNSYESLNAFITATDTALTNAMLPDVQPLLQRVGCQPAGLAAKMASLKTLRQLAEKQQKEYGDQYKATSDYQKQFDKLNADYTDHVTLARIDFEENPAALTTLGLAGRRKRNRDDYSKQALQLYNGALGNAEYAATLAESGIDAAKLQEMQAGFAQLETLDKAQTSETSEAQQATVDRDNAWDLLEEWMRKFYKKATVALKNSPQLREKLGIIER